MRGRYYRCEIAGDMPGNSEAGLQFAQKRLACLGMSHTVNHNPGDWADASPSTDNSQIAFSLAAKSADEAFRVLHEIAQAVCEGDYTISILQFARDISYNVQTVWSE